jgi:hypothetical protein
LRLGPPEVGKGLGFGISVVAEGATTMGEITLLVFLSLSRGAKETTSTKQRSQYFSLHHFGLLLRVISPHKLWLLKYNNVAYIKHNFSKLF